MPQITLRANAGTSSDLDLIVEVKDATYEYLLTSVSPTIRVSAYLEREYPEVAATYAEIFVKEGCPFHSKIKSITPGSRSRQGIQLPGPMHAGEQLTVQVIRTPLSG